MPNLNNTQKSFRKQIEELKKDKNIIETMKDHDSFYNNKAYKDKTKYKRKSNVPKVFYFAFALVFLIPFLTDLDFTEIWTNIKFYIALIKTLYINYMT